MRDTEVPDDQEATESAVIRYYSKTESRVGYKYLLGGTKHLGYYRPKDRALPFGPAMRRMEDKLVQALDLPPGSLLLDAGCGVGDVAVRLARDFGMRVSGIDILDFNIDEARQRASAQQVGDRVEFLQMSFARLQFPPERFDGVYTVETLVHASDPRAVLQEYRRVLKPGGHIALFEYSRAPDEAMPPRARRVFAEINSAGAMPGFQQLHHGVLEKLLGEVGFTDLQREDITERAAPMVRAFAVIGSIPYAIGVSTRRRIKVLNAMAAVEYWRYRRFLRYNVYTAVK